MGATGIAEELFAADLTTNGIALGVDGPKRNVRNRLTGLPDLQTKLEDLFAAGDRVVVRVRWHGTHRGPYSNAQQQVGLIAPELYAAQVPAGVV